MVSLWGWWVGCSLGCGESRSSRSDGVLTVTLRSSVSRSSTRRARPRALGATDWMVPEEHRRRVIAQSHDTVKRAIAAANDIAQRDLRRKRVGLLLLALLFFSAWRLARPGRTPNSDPSTAQLVPRRKVSYSRDLLNASIVRRGRRRGKANRTAVARFNSTAGL